MRQRPYVGVTAILCDEENWNRTRHRSGKTCCRRAVILAGTMVLHRFLISGPDLAIAAAMGYIPATSVQRFLISSPNLRIDAAKRSKRRQSLQPNDWSIVPRPGNAGWAGTSDGVAARGFVRGPQRSGGRESTAGAHRSEVPACRQTRTRRQRKPRRQTRPRRQPLPRRQSRPREPSAPGTKKRVPTHR